LHFYEVADGRRADHFSYDDWNRFPRLVGAMTAAPDAPQQTSATWTTLEVIDDVRRGTIAPMRRLVVSAERLDRIATALQRCVGPFHGAVSVADICPDPLVFALESGLPRLMTFGRSIDGGSEWHDCAAIDGDSVFAVSSIADVAERVTADGRRLVRVTYVTQFSSPRGELIGTAAGTSLHVGSDG
jgi:hypothetical protein